MPDKEAKIGDVYYVHRVAVVETRDPKPARPMVCVAELRLDPAIWRAMPRLTHGNTEDDLPSPADASLRLSKPGWWTWRFIHAVKKADTGGLDCSFSGSMGDLEKNRVLDHYRGRPKPSSK